jgi:pimeloyl-ACP methyl ester carboxylesterase
MSAVAERISSPPLLYTALETRALGERVQMSVLMPLLQRLPRGDGHPVLVLPGLSAGDNSTAPLRNVLKHLGYRTYGWGLGANVGPTNRILDGLVRRLDRAHQRRGDKVSIVGWSLGGLYARELARARPDQVRMVVSLGSPIQMSDGDSSAAKPVWDALGRYHSVSRPKRVRDIEKAVLTTPSSSIYSCTDGVVSWQASLVPRNAISENIRVFGSHCGLGFNSAAVFAIADRLAQPDGEWKHFRAPWYLRGAFPPASNLDPSKLPKGD